jgi:modulator of FtsH protease HflK
MRYFLAVCFLLLAGYALSGFVQVRPGERAVIRRFGRVVATPGPGLWVGLPWGMDRVDRVPVDRLRRVTVGYQPDEEDGPVSSPGQLLTGDHNLVNVRVAVQYSVDEQHVVDFVEQSDRVDDLVSRAAEAVLAEWVAGRPIDEVLVAGKVEIPQVVVQATQERVEPYRVGLQIADADVVYLFPPDEVKNAFDEVTRAQTSIRTREHEARQEAARLLRDAETEKFRLERQAEAYVDEKLRLAQAEAERFDKRREQYHRLRAGNPDFLKGIWWDEIGKLLTRLRENGGLDLLDHRLGADGLDITVMPPMPKKK